MKYLASKAYSFGIILYVLTCMWIIFGNPPQIVATMMFVISGFLVSSTHVVPSFVLWLYAAIKSTFRADYSTTSSFDEIIDAALRFDPGNKVSYGALIFTTSVLLASIFLAIRKRISHGYN
jgi:hypothetical protein